MNYTGTHFTTRLRYIILSLIRVLYYPAVSFDFNKIETYYEYMAAKFLTKGRYKCSICIYRKINSIQYYMFVRE